MSLDRTLLVTVERAINYGPGFHTLTFY